MKDRDFLPGPNRTYKRLGRTLPKIGSYNKIRKVLHKSIFSNTVLKPLCYGNI